jgi:hypothetical protein
MSIIEEILRLKTRYTREHAKEPTTVRLGKVTYEQLRKEFYFTLGRRNKNYSIVKELVKKPFIEQEIHGLVIELEEQHEEAIIITNQRIF